MKTKMMNNYNVYVEKVVKDGYTPISYSEWICRLYRKGKGY